MPKLFIDLETYSSVDLPRSGVYRYAEAPDFKILMAAWSLDGGPVEVALTDEDIWAIPGLWDPSVEKVAHNAQFERICLSSFAGLPVGTYLDPEVWDDTQAIAAELGLPQRLGVLAPALGADLKDEAGTRLINIFSKPNRKGLRTLPEDKPTEWLDFIEYCIQDVYSLIDVYNKLQSMGGWPTEHEREIFWTDQRINDLGMLIDTELAARAVEAAEANQARQKFELSDATGWVVENANSNPQMMEWVRAEGLPAKNLQAATVSSLLETDLTETQRTVLELRQDLALVASKKFSSALGAVSPDDRIRGTLKYFGAHTGRWAGRGTQVHNLPSQKIELTADDKAELSMMRDLGAAKSKLEARENEMRLAETERLIAALKTGGGADSNTLKALVRPMFHVDGVVVDYSSIEAVVIAWLAGEEWALQAFRERRDIYVETAGRMSTPSRQLTRSQGKVAVLALGFGGAINSLRVMGAEGGDDDLMMLVKQWRRANPKIVQLWAQLGDAFGEPGSAGSRLRITEDFDELGRALYLHLPSGRSIGYHGTKWERYKVPHPTIPGKFLSKEGWRYANAKDPFNPKMRIGTYGGRLAENATQAVARDFMAAGLVRLQAEGYHPVGHVHDEILVPGTRDVDAVAEIMCQLPDWAEGLPISAAGFVTDRYRKD